MTYTYLIFYAHVSHILYSRLAWPLLMIASHDYYLSVERRLDSEPSYPCSCVIYTYSLYTLQLYTLKPVLGRHPIVRCQVALYDKVATQDRLLSKHQSECTIENFGGLLRETKQYKDTFFYTLFVS